MPNKTREEKVAEYKELGLTDMEIELLLTPLKNLSEPHVPAMFRARDRRDDLVRTENAATRESEEERKKQSLYR